MPTPERSGKTCVVIATHGHCFDGLCSAVLFTRVLQQLRPDDELEFRYHALGYGPGQNGVDPALLCGDVNVILDYRFSALASLGWYFDHHVSAFSTTADRAAYDAHVASARAGERRMFHDGTYGSCTRLIADTAAATFGLDTTGLAKLVGWADVIDRAAFPSAQMAVERSVPELRLMTVIEHHGDDAFLARYVPALLARPLEDVARDPEIDSAAEPLLVSHRAFVKLVEEHGRDDRGVVLVDLADVELDVASKFVTYALYPESAYSVVLTRSRAKCKLSVGYNPWCGKARRHDIAAICGRYGGGGHPVVGAVALMSGDVTEGRRIAEEIAEELRR